jgi:hypothetical protein
MFWRLTGATVRAEYERAHPDQAAGQTAAYNAQQAHQGPQEAIPWP